MKKNFSLILTIALAMSLTIVSAQAPKAFNYQAVARDGSGQILSNKSIGIEFTISTAASGGTALYKETFTKSTNEFGLFTAEIGRGTVVSGTFADIDWAGGDRFLSVGIDPAGGTSYAPMGSSQFLSVPYALQAGSWRDTADNIVNTNLKNVGIGTTGRPTSKLQVRSIDNTTASFSRKEVPSSLLFTNSVVYMYADSIEKNSSVLHLSLPRTTNDTANYIKFTKPSVLLPNTTTITKITADGNIKTQGKIQRFATGDANMVPIAYGAINAAGVITSGSGNFTVTWNGAQSRYEISIDNEAFYFSKYITLVTPMGGGALIPRTNSMSDKLLVELYNLSNASVQGVFSFVVYKP